MSDTFIDVHTFDGKLKNIFKPSREYTINEKRKMLKFLKSKLIDPQSQHMIDIIINDLNVKHCNNFQIENNMDCSDIVADIINYKDFDNILSLLEEQLKDAFLLGRCASGKCTRIYQIWKAIYEK